MSDQSATNPKDIKVHVTNNTASPSTDKAQNVKSGYKSPFEEAGFFSRLHFTWVIPFVRMVNRIKGSISIEDIPDLGKSESPEVFEQRFTANYENAKKRNPKGKASLFWAVLKGVKKELLILICCLICFLVVRILYGYFLREVLSALSDPSKTKGDAFLWAIGLILCILSSFYFNAHAFYNSQRAGLYLKSGIILMLYKKINKVSSWSLQKLSFGKVVNLAANDVNLLDSSIYFIPNLFLAPISFVGAGLLLWDFFGASCLVGLGYILFCQPMNTLLTYMTKHSRMMKNKVTDDRVRLTNETIDGIRLLKMYGWELSFRDFIKDLRDKEIKYLKKMLSFDNFKLAISYSGYGLGSFLIFLVYTVTGGEVTSEKVFPTLFVMSFLRQVAGGYLALGITFFYDFILFFDRVKQIMDLPEVKSVEGTQEAPQSEKNIIEYQNYTAYWTEKGQDDKPVLKNLNLNIQKNTLTAIIGKIGSGKSTLLNHFLRNFEG